MTRKNALLALLTIIVLGVGIRTYQLTGRSLWFDEAFSWRIIQFSLPELLDRAGADVHPPLYYLLLKSWAVVFGTSLFSLRLFSITSAAASLGAMYMLVTELLHAAGIKLAAARSGGLISALLLAVSAWQISLAGEARMYTLGTLLVLLATWLLVKAIQEKHIRPWWWIGYGLAAAACVYTHYYTFFTLAAQALWILGVIVAQSRGRIGEIASSRTLWYAGLSYVLAIGLFIPWLPTFLQQNSRVQQDFWIEAPNIWSIPDTLYRMVAPTQAKLTHTWPSAFITLSPLIIFLLGAAVLVIACHAKGRHPHVKSAGWLIVTGASIPFMGSFLLSQFGQSVYTDRFFAFSHLFIVAGAALLVYLVPIRWLKMLIVAVIVISSLGFFAKYVQDTNINGHPGTRAAINYLVEKKPAGEPSYATSPFIFFPALYYVQAEFQAISPLHLIFDPSQLTHYNGQPIAKDSDIVSLENSNTANAKSIWLIETTGFYASPLSLPSPWRLTQEKTFPEAFAYQGNVIVRHYTRN